MFALLIRPLVFRFVLSQLKRRSGYSDSGGVSVTIKATSALSILAIWAAMVPAIVIEPGAWWSLMFAALATAAIGIGSWRKLGLSRLIAIAGTWAGAAIAIANAPGSAWVSVFAFLTTAVVVYSIMKRDAYLGGLGIAIAWLVTGAVIADTGEGVWISVFAFLTAAAVANSFGRKTRGIAAAVAWLAAGAIMLSTGGWFWLAVIAFFLSASSLGLDGVRIPRSFEWDLFDRDDDSERIKSSASAARTVSPPDR